MATRRDIDVPFACRGGKVTSAPRGKYQALPNARFLGIPCSTAIPRHGSPRFPSSTRRQPSSFPLPRLSHSAHTGANCSGARVNFFLFDLEAITEK